MSTQASDDNREKPFFVNQFVNTVYGILLGYGFSDSMSRIEEQIESGTPGSVGIPFSIVAVLYVIIVICVYWWDWVDNVGHRVQNTAREFALDISILVSLESLFFVFVFEYPVVFTAIFLLLSVLNLLWVYNLRFDEFQACKSAGTLNTWTEYLGTNKQAKKHIRNRWYGIVLFGGCVIFALFSKKHDLDGAILDSLFATNGATEYWGGYWSVIFLIPAAGLFNRLVLYRDRFGD